MDDDQDKGEVGGRGRGREKKKTVGVRVTDVDADGEEEEEENKDEGEEGEEGEAPFGFADGPALLRAAYWRFAAGVNVRAPLFPSAQDWKLLDVQQRGGVCDDLYQYPTREDVKEKNKTNRPPFDQKEGGGGGGGGGFLAEE